jgi:hypothetical protein
VGHAKVAQGAGLSAALFMGIGGLRGGKIGANGKMQYNLGCKYLNAPVCAPFANLPPPITEMVPPTTASLAVLPIISDIFFECSGEPR